MNNGHLKRTTDNIGTMESVCLYWSSRSTGLKRHRDDNKELYENNKNLDFQISGNNIYIDEKVYPKPLLRNVN